MMDVFPDDMVTFPCDSDVISEWACSQTPERVPKRQAFCDSDVMSEQACSQTPGRVPKRQSPLRQYVQ